MVPVLIGTCVAARQAVFLIYGPGYEGAVPVVRVLTGYVLLTLLNSIMICTLIAFGRTTAYSLIVSGGALIVCVMVVVFTALFGPVGAGAGIIAGEAVMLVFLIRAAHSVAPLPSLLFLLKPAIAGIVMAVSSFALAGLHPMITLVGSTALFVIVLFSINGVPRQEIRYLRERLI
jgi:O-antigen/teichoic acid export membrane protein